MATDNKDNKMPEDPQDSEVDSTHRTVAGSTRRTYLSTEDGTSARRASIRSNPEVSAAHLAPPNVSERRSSFGGGDVKEPPMVFDPQEIARTALGGNAVMRYNDEEIRKREEERLRMKERLAEQMRISEERRAEERRLAEEMRRTEELLRDAGDVDPYSLLDENLKKFLESEDIPPSQRTLILSHFYNIYYGACRALPKCPAVATLESSLCDPSMQCILRYYPTDEGWSALRKAANKLRDATDLNDIKSEVQYRKKPFPLCAATLETA